MAASVFSRSRVERASRSSRVTISVYEWGGLEVLRRAWLNIDALWVTALLATGMLMLLNTF
jgi:hypothetical protein